MSVCHQLSIDLRKASLSLIIACVCVCVFLRELLAQKHDRVKVHHENPTPTLLLLNTEATTTFSVLNVDVCVRVC